MRPDRERAGPQREPAPATPQQTTATRPTGILRDQTDEAAQPAIPGVDRAIRHRDDWWWSGAMRALEHEATSGRPFAADDLAETYGLPAPDHPGRWGALFRVAHKRGLVEPVGFRQSRSPSRAGGVLRVWRGSR